MMIVNAQEDMQGNAKENIFIALGDTWDYLAHAYVYPYENHHVSYARPRNIVMAIKADDALEAENPGLRQSLFDACLKRAHELKAALWPQDTVQLYGGLFAQETSMLRFFINQGFLEDDAVLTMRLDSLECASPISPATITQLDAKDATVVAGYLQRHNEMYVQPLHEAQFHELAGRRGFRLFGLTAAGQLAGECMFYEKEGAGYIESFHLCPGHRGQGFADVLLGHVIAYCREQHYQSAGLEVWKRNERAIRLYQKFGFQVTGKTECYPGIVLN